MEILCPTTLGLAALCVALAPGAGGGRDASTPGEGPAGARMVIVQPGFPGSTADAAGYVGRLASYLEKKVPLEGLSGAYYNVPDDALGALEAEPAQLGIVSLGFFLEHRKELRMRPLLEVLPEGRFYVVAPRNRLPEGGAFDLAGKRVVGGALYEEKLLRRVALRELKGVDDWKAARTLKITRGLRKLEQGEYDAAVLNGREYRALEPTLKGLEVVRRSEEYPAGLVVSFGPGDGGVGRDGGDGGDGGKAGDRKIADAFLEMVKDREGKDILETFGCEGFRPVRADWLEKMEKRYDDREKKK